MKYLIFLLIPFVLFAQPNITSVTFSSGDTIQHGLVITINGTGFGTKSPAPPIIWDNCENRLTGTGKARTGNPWKYTSRIAEDNDRVVSLIWGGNCENRGRGRFIDF